MPKMQVGKTPLMNLCTNYVCTDKIQEEHNLCEANNCDIVQNIFNKSFLNDYFTFQWHMPFKIAVGHQLALAHMLSLARLDERIEK